MKNPAYCKRILVVLLLVVATGLAVNRGHAQELPELQGPPYRPTRPIAIVGGLLIDGTGRSPQHDQAVLVVGERIDWIGPMEEILIPEGAEVIDAKGMTIMPGLINGNAYIQLRAIYPAPAADLTLEEFQARWEETWSTWKKRAFTWLMVDARSHRHQEYQRTPREGAGMEACDREGRGRRTSCLLGWDPHIQRASLQVLDPKHARPGRRRMDAK